VGALRPHSCSFLKESVCVRVRPLSGGATRAGARCRFSQSSCWDYPIWQHVPQHKNKHKQWEIPTCSNLVFCLQT
jgi:hypothetical protein